MALVVKNLPANTGDIRLTFDPWVGKILGGKAMTNLGSVLKSRGVTLLTKVHIVKVMVFPVIMYRYES